MSEREFTLASILWITTRRFLLPFHLLEVYRLLTFLVGDRRLNISVSDAWEECRAELIRQHPVLEAISAPGWFVNDEDTGRWIVDQEILLGRTLPIKPPEYTIPPVQTTTKNEDYFATALRMVSTEVEKIQTDPWQLAAMAYQVGAEIEGRITDTSIFGALVQIEPALVGFAHISRLGSRANLKPGQCPVEAEQMRTFRIINIDLARHRIQLELKE